MASRGWAAGCPSQKTPESSSAPPPRSVNKSAGIRFLGSLCPRGSTEVWSGLAGGSLPPRPRGGAGGQVFDWARVSGAGGSSAVCLGVWWLVCDRVSVCSHAPGWCWSVCAPLASPPHGCAARKAADSRPSARAGPASRVPRPFHPPLLRPGLATGPVITWGQDATANPALTPWGGAWGRGGPRLAPSPGRKLLEVRLAVRTVNIYPAPTRFWA